MRKGNLRIGVLLASVALLVAACSSSGGGSSAGGSGTSGAGLTGDPIKFGLMGDLTVPGADYHPQAWNLAQIAAAAINDNGGINGRPLQLVVCDSKQDAQTAVLCAQKLLVQDKVLAIVGGFDTEENASLYPTLKQANTIFFGDYPSSPEDDASPLSYPLVTGPLQFSAMPKLVPSSSKKTAIVYGQSAPATLLAKSMAASLPQGIQSTLIGIPASGSVDMTPYCLQLKQSGADTALAALGSSVLNQLLNTCRQNGVTDIQWVLSDMGIDDDSVTLLQDLSPAPKVLLTFAGTAMDEMQKQIEKYGKRYGNTKGATLGLAKNSWLSVTLAAQILKTMPTANGAALAAYLDKQSALDTGATPPLDFTKPGPSTKFSRIVNHFGAPGEFRDGALAKTGEFFSLTG